jgi:putative tryptophan/tyrosine transport system substrate-binding protein
MRRRDFIKVVASSAAVAWPLALRAQQPNMSVVGFIHPLSPERVPHFVAALHQGLREVGFVEGENIAVEYRWAYAQYDRLPELAAELRVGRHDRDRLRLRILPHRQIEEAFGE